MPQALQPRLKPPFPPPDIVIDTTRNLEKKIGLACEEQMGVTPTAQHSFLSRLGAIYLTAGRKRVVGGAAGGWAEPRTWPPVGLSQEHIEIGLM